MHSRTISDCGSRPQRDPAGPSTELKGQCTAIDTAPCSASYFKANQANVIALEALLPESVI